MERLVIFPQKEKKSYGESVFDGGVGTKLAYLDFLLSCLVGDTLDVNSGRHLGCCVVCLICSLVCAKLTVVVIISASCSLWSRSKSSQDCFVFIGLRGFCVNQELRLRSTQNSLYVMACLAGERADSGRVKLRHKLPRIRARRLIWRLPSLWNTKYEGM